MAELDTTRPWSTQYGLGAGPGNHAADRRGLRVCSWARCLSPRHFDNVSRFEESIRNCGTLPGVISIFLFQFGVFPIAAAILSGMGLAEQKHYRSGRGQAIAGFVLGFIYTLMFIRGVAR